MNQFIENGFQRGKVTGVEFLVLSIAYDTVNHKLLTKKLYEITKAYTLAKSCNAYYRIDTFSSPYKQRTADEKYRKMVLLVALVVYWRL